MTKANDKSLKDCFCKHLPYEISMMRGAYRELVAPKPLVYCVDPTFEANMRIECFCLHARALIEFFKGKDSSDFDPTDFAVEGYKLNKRFVGDSTLPKLNEQLSHLSRRRTDVAGEQLSGHDFTKIYAAIEGEISRMIASLTPRWKALCKIPTAAPEISVHQAPAATNQISAAFTDVRTVGS